MSGNLGILLVFALLVTVFAVENSAPVTVHFLFWRFGGISLALVILFSVLLGVLLSWFQAYRGLRQRQKDRSETTQPGSRED